jgi:hypothetical protein
MSAAAAIVAARAAGVHLGIDGDDLVRDASAAPPDTVLDLLSRHKPGIVALLRPGQDGWTAEDWRAFFDERAGIAEFDGGLPCAQAEARAINCCVVQWLNRNPIRSSPDRCLGCGKVEDADDVLLPFGTEGAGHSWLHSRCWSGWFARRKAHAVAVLEARGIATPAGFPNDFDKNGGA